MRSAKVLWQKVSLKLDVDWARLKNECRKKLNYKWMNKSRKGEKSRKTPDSRGAPVAFVQQYVVDQTPGQRMSTLTIKCTVLGRYHSTLIDTQ